MLANSASNTACSATTRAGQPCAAPPLREGRFCASHDPEYADTMQQARTLGGQRRRKEVAVGAAYDFEGLHTVPQIRRLIEVAVIDTLSLENSVSRSRAIAYLAHTAAQLLEAGELEQRLERIEQALAPRKQAR
jgi:hypothetical protein